MTVGTSKARFHNNGGFFVRAQPSPRSTTSISGSHSKEIAILGGGITGLASAFYLSRALPHAKVTIFEATERVGGWVHSEHVDVGNGKVVLEQGPRTLRPSGAAAMVTLELIKKLGIENEILITSKMSDAARNRFIYYPDHLVRLPDINEIKMGPFKALRRMLKEPISKGIFPGVARDFFRPGRPDTLEDESVGSFINRRLGNSNITDNIVSAVFHGIYAGDVYQLSAKSILSALWRWEEEEGSLFRCLFKNVQSKSTPVKYKDGLLLQDLYSRTSELARFEEMKLASVYSFKRGIGTLPEALVSALLQSRVRIKRGQKVIGVALDEESNRIEISCRGNQPPAKFDQVISTISSCALSYVAGSKQDLPSLQSTHAVTVMVVNLYYRDVEILPVHGFGYLIPRSVPWNQNPERALGVTFDSDASIGQDTATGTKVTVMLGGHWWDDFNSYPDEAEGAAMAKAVLKRHLNIEAEPHLVNVALQKDCIPQYTVGHASRMKQAHNDLIETFNGKLAVAGNSYTGVGLNDCVRAAKDVVTAIQNAGEEGVTGLEQFTSEQKWGRAELNLIPVRANSGKKS